MTFSTENWNNYLSVPDNKRDLMKFLSEEVLVYNFKGTQLVVAGRFKDPCHVKSMRLDSDVKHLVLMHEEASTRIVLHAVHNKVSNVVSQSH